MQPKAKTALLSVVAPLLVLAGLFLLVVSPFLPLLYMDLDPPRWLNTLTLALLGLASISLGIWVWGLAWRRWFPKPFLDSQKSASAFEETERV